MKKLYAKIENLHRKLASFLHMLKLDDSSRSKVLQKFPPKFPRVVAKHCTYYYGSNEDFEMPKVSKVRVIGYASDAYLETAVCEVDGKLKSPDGRIFHITISLDPAHRETHDSNALLFKGNWDKVTPFTVSVSPVRKEM